MAVVSDRKVVKAVGTDISYYADVVSATDYYAFGMVMADRSWNTEGYRYGFNGKENDNEVKGTGNQQDYGMRIYDARLGRFLSVDPLTKDYPELTPYQFASNKPINSIDLDGEEAKEVYNAFAWGANKAWGLVKETVKGTVVLAIATQNPVVAAHVANNVYQSTKSTVQDVSTIYGTGAQIAYQKATGQSVKVDEEKFNAAAKRQAKAIVRTGTSAVIATGAGLAVGEIAQVSSKIKAKASNTSLQATGLEAMSAEAQTAVKGGNGLKSFDDLTANPKEIWGKSADEVGEILGSNWEKAPLNSGEGWKFMQKNGDGFVSYTTGNSHHPNST